MQKEHAIVKDKKKIVDQLSSYLMSHTSEIHFLLVFVDNNSSELQVVATSIRYHQAR